MLDEMRGFGLVPSLTTYNLLLRGVQKRGSEAIFQVYEKMQGENIVPGAYAAGFILPPCIEQRKLRTAYRLLSEAVESCKTMEAKRRLAHNFGELALAAGEQDKPKISQLCDFQQRKLLTDVMAAEDAADAAKPAEGRLYRVLAGGKSGA